MPTQNRKAAIKKLKLLVYTPKIEVEDFRKRLDDAFCSPFVPNGVDCKERDFGGVKCDFLSPELYSSKRIMLYIHGGCFVGGSKAAYRSFVASLANRGFTRAVVPEYRLAPTHPFPACIEDIQSVFKSLYTEEQIARSLDVKNKAAGEEMDDKPEFIVCADGAGASIAMALLLNLKDRFRSSIKQVVFFSPWLNLTDGFLKKYKKYSDEIMNVEYMIKCRELYTYETNFSNPLVSSVLAKGESLKDFPSTYIQIGEKEILLDEVRHFQSILQANGGDCKIDVAPGMMHMYQMADCLDESHEALDKFQDIISGLDLDQNKVSQTFDNKPRLEQSLKAEA